MGSDPRGALRTLKALILWACLVAAACAPERSEAGGDADVAGPADVAGDEGAGVEPNSDTNGSEETTGEADVGEIGEPEVDLEEPEDDRWDDDDPGSTLCKTSCTCSISCRDGVLRSSDLYDVDCLCDGYRDDCGSPCRIEGGIECELYASDERERFCPPSLYECSRPDSPQRLLPTTLGPVSVAPETEVAQMGMLSDGGQTMVWWVDDSTLRWLTRRSAAHRVVQSERPEPQTQIPEVTEVVELRGSPTSFALAYTQESPSGDWSVWTFDMRDSSGAVGPPARLLDALPNAPYLSGATNEHRRYVLVADRGLEAVWLTRLDRGEVGVAEVPELAETLRSELRAGGDPALAAAEHPVGVLVTYQVPRESGLELVFVVVNLEGGARELQRLPIASAPGPIAPVWYEEAGEWAFAAAIEPDGSDGAPGADEVDLAVFWLSTDGTVREPVKFARVAPLSADGLSFSLDAQSQGLVALTWPGSTRPGVGAPLDAVHFSEVRRDGVIVVRNTEEPNRRYSHAYTAPEGWTLGRTSSATHAGIHEVVVEEARQDDPQTRRWVLLGGSLHCGEPAPASTEE